MSGLTTKFTDYKLKILYGNLLKHYKNLEGAGIYEMHSQMLAELQSAMFYQPNSPFYHLDLAEKAKAYQAFDTIFRALPIYQQHPPQQPAFNPPIPQFRPTVYVEIHEHNYYNNTDSTLLNCILLDSMLHNHHGPGYHRGSCLPSNSHGHGTNDDLTKLIAFLLILALALVAVVLAFLAMAYMINEFADSMERFWYGEGWLKGALMFATSIGFGAGSAFLTMNFGAAPLIALAIAAGCNPVGVVAIGVVLLGVIGAGVGAFAMSLLYDSANKSANKESMDPADPDRFRLTASDEAFLRDKKNMDPMAVKCAMIAYRAEMAKLLGNEKAIPSFFNRDKGVQKLLNELRQLRRGEVSVVDVGGLHFDCKIPPRTYVPVLVQQTPSYYEQPPAYHAPTYQAQESRDPTNLTPVYQAYQPQMHQVGRQQSPTYEPPTYQPYQDPSSQVDAYTPSAPYNFQ